MRIKFDTWSGTYSVFRPGKPVELRKDKTPKMREIIKNVEPKTEGHFIVWEDGPQWKNTH